MKIINNYKITTLLFLVILNISGSSCFSFYGRTPNYYRNINIDKNDIYVKIDKKLFINSLDKAIESLKMDKKYNNELIELKKFYLDKSSSDLIGYKRFSRLQNEYPNCFFEKSFIVEVYK